MKEFLELRIWKEKVPLLFPEEQSEGVRVAHKVLLPLRDPRVAKAAVLDESLRRQGDSLFSYWAIHREYDPSELSSAELLKLEITASFEPTGEECGTIYDDSEACPVCGAGRRQVSELHLDFRTISKGVDIARTIAGNEWVVSPKLGSLLTAERVSGFELRPILPPARRQNRARESQASRVSEWRQLVVTSRALRVHPMTVVGSRPFMTSGSSNEACPLGDTIGNRLISEVSVHARDWDGGDFMQTAQFVGGRSGLLSPERVIIVSQRLFRILNEHGIRGFRAEVVHLV